MKAEEASILRGIPEFFEKEIGESLGARSEQLSSFRELGPPDLVHVVKHNPKGSGSVKEIGSYHYVLGADTSSSASMAAYLTSLNFIIEDSQTWTTSKPNWKIKSGTFCTFNAFSRVDIRVEVRIPGGVDCYIVDLRGERHPISNQAIWSETSVSAILRAILDDNDEPDGNDGHPLLGLRKLDPLPTPSLEKCFLDNASVEFWKGWQLGTDPEVQVATYFCNHLTNGIFKYFHDAGRSSEAANFFLPLFRRDPEVGAVLAKAYFNCNEEIKGVQVLYEALERNPLSYGLILAQIDFLRTKKRHDIALKLAKLAVTFAPSEYNSWAKLTQVYIELDDYNSALLSLNSCPMFSYSEKDSHKMPQPTRAHFPLKFEFDAKEEDLKKRAPGVGRISDDNDPREDEVHPELLRLPALSLRGTFYKAYLLLTDICNKVGWDELLKHRSVSFVMEEEYRAQRSSAERNGSSNDSDEDELDEKPNAPPMIEPDDNEEDSLPVAMENISLDSKPIQNIPLNDETSSSSSTTPNKLSPTKSIDILVNGDISMLQQTNIKEEQEEDLNDLSPKKQKPAKKSSSLATKRLCEKWLDNLFMVLYNDLRLYTALKQEFTHYKNSQGNSQTSLMYRKTGAEWEIYGDLALRLGHSNDAKEAYSLCLEQKYSAKSYLKLLQLAADGADIRETLLCVVRIIAAWDRTYVETIYPSPVGRALLKIIRVHGLSKVQNVLLAMNVSAKRYALVVKFFDYAETFKCDGVED